MAPNVLFFPAKSHLQPISILVNLVTILVGRMWAKKVGFSVKKEGQIFDTRIGTFRRTFLTNVRNFLSNF